MTRSVRMALVFMSTCHTSLSLSQPRTKFLRRREHRHTSRICMQSGKGGGDDRFSPRSFLAKSTFDALSFRSFRQETLLQYGTTNQSEPLRIILYLFATFALLVAPSFGDLFDQPFNPVETVGSTFSAAAAGFLFNRERLRRTSQLIRLEREAVLGDLKIVLTVVNRLGGPPQRSVFSLRELRGHRRIVVLYGNATQLRQMLEVAAGYGRRIFPTSGVVVVAVANDGSQRSDWAPHTVGCSSRDLAKTGFNLDAFGESHMVFLAEPLASSANDWSNYFDELLGNASPSAEAASGISILRRLPSLKSDPRFGSSEIPEVNQSLGGFVALNFRGRSVSSGRFEGHDTVSLSSSVNWDELLGRRFVPTEMLIPESRDSFFEKEDAPETKDTSGERKALANLLSRQGDFYEALISGHAEVVEELFLGESASVGGSEVEKGSSAGLWSDDVSQVVREGGRLDDWTFCLLDGNRPPADMQTSNADAALFYSSTTDDENRVLSHATTTLLEFPRGSGPGSCQLSMQKWVPNHTRDAATGEVIGVGDITWRLATHRTIPYSQGSAAGGLLRCDCRGCVALLARKDSGLSGGWKGLVESWI